MPSPLVRNALWSRPPVARDRLAVALAEWHPPRPERTSEAFRARSKGLDAPCHRESCEVFSKHSLQPSPKWEKAAQGRADDATAHSGAARDIWAELPRGSGGNIGGHRQTHPAIAQPRSRAAPAERTRARSRAAAALGGGRLLTRAPRGWRRGELEHDCLGQLLRHTSPPSPRSRPFLLLACSGCVSSRGVSSRVLLPPLPPLPPLGRL